MRGGRTWRIDRIRIDPFCKAIYVEDQNACSSVFFTTMYVVSSAFFHTAQYHVINFILLIGSQMLLVVTLRRHASPSTLFMTFLSGRSRFSRNPNLIVS